MSFGDHAFGERTFSALRETMFNLVGEGDISISREFRIFSATEEFVTLPTDTLATQPFFGTLVQPLKFSRSLLGSDIIGNFTTGTGELQLANTDGGYDFLIQRFAIDGRAIEVKVGREGDSYDNFYTIFSGMASDWTVNEDAVVISLVDKAYMLEVAAQPNLYGGAGGVDGTADLVGKRKPRAFGTVNNVSPPLVIPSSLVYQVNDGPISSITAVYDRGSLLTYSGGDYATVALLLAAPPPAGKYSICSGLGYFSIGSAPVGTVTADVIGEIGASATSSDVVRRIISTTTKIGDPSGLYLPSFVSVAAQQPASVGFWIAPDDTSTVSDVISHIMGAVGGWGGFRRSGQFEVGIFKSPVGITPSAFFDKADIQVIKREALPSSLSPPPYRFRVAYQHNWTVQTDLAGAVPATRVSFLAQADRYSESSNATIITDHPFAKDRNPIPSYFQLQTDAQTESDRLLALYKGSNALYRFTVGVEPFALNLGEVVNVTYPRWDLTVGRALMIVEMSEDAQANTIEIVGYG